MYSLITGLAAGRMRWVSVTSNAFLVKQVDGLTTGLDVEARKSTMIGHRPCGRAKAIFYCPPTL